MSTCPNPSIIPRFQKLYFCRCGHRDGRQICLFLGYRGDRYVVRKWLASSKRWTKPTTIIPADLVSVASKDECRKRGLLSGQIPPDRSNP